MNELENQFWRDAFLKALGETINVTGWTNENGPVETVEARVDLAKSFADEATRVALRVYRI